MPNKITKKRFGFATMADLGPADILDRHSTGLDLKENTKTIGIVTKVDEHYVYLDIGSKSEGKIPVAEFQLKITDEQVEDNEGEASATSKDNGVPSAGSQVEVFITKLEGRNGRPILSKTEALKTEAYAELQKMYENRDIVQGKIVSPVKAGYIVLLKNCVTAFLPGSQLELGAMPKNASSYIGKVFDFRISNMTNTPKVKNIVVSRRDLLEDASRANKSNTIKYLTIGSQVKGIVKNVVWYGAFVRIPVEVPVLDGEEPSGDEISNAVGAEGNGDNTAEGSNKSAKTTTQYLDGLVHVTDIAWDRIEHPSEKLSPGDEWDLIIKDIDPESLKVQLSIKLTQPNPWDQVEQKYPVGTKLKGKISSIAHTDSCAFVNFGDSIEGILPSNEIVWSKSVSPKKHYFIGQELDVVVIEVDKMNHKLILSVKQLTENPWKIFASQYNVGDKLSLKVESIKEYGAFLSLINKDGSPLNIEGLLHLYDISWEGDGHQKLAKFVKGDVVDCTILSIDTERQKVNLGVKQLSADPYKEVYEKYKPGDELTITIQGRGDDYLVARTAEDVMVVIPRSGIASAASERRFDRFSDGESVKCIISAVERQESRIIASVADYEKRAMQADHDAPSVGSMLNAQ